MVVVSVNYRNFAELHLRRLRRITFRFYLFKRILLTKFALRETNKQTNKKTLIERTPFEITLNKQNYLIT